MEDLKIKNTVNIRSHKVRPINQSTPSLKYRPGASFTDWNKVKLQRSPPKQKFQLHKPVRIPIPHFFNIPPHEHPSSKEEEHTNIYVTTKPIKQLTIPAQFSRKIKELNIMREAMKRAKQLKSEARCDYSLGVLYQNLQNYNAAEKHYQRFLRIAVYFKDQKSIELVMNTLGIIYMKNKQYSTSLEYHQKQVEISNERNKFIGYINLAKCYEQLGEPTKAMDQLSKAKFIAEQEADQYRIDFIEELMIDYKQKSPFLTEDLTKEIQNYYSRETKTKNKASPQKLVKSHMRLGDINMSKGQYATSGAQYAKSIEFAQMNNSPKVKQLNKEMLKNIRLGYSISRAENKMNQYLESLKGSFRYSRDFQN